MSVMSMREELEQVIKLLDINAAEADGFVDPEWWTESAMERELSAVVLLKEMLTRLPPRGYINPAMLYRP